MNSQKVHNVTKMHVRYLLSLSLQLLQPKREAAEGKTKDLEKPTNNENIRTHYGVNNMADVCVLYPLKFMRFFEAAVVLTPNAWSARMMLRRPRYRGWLHP